MNIKILDIAQCELDDAFSYYELQQYNLGYRFISDIEETLDRIKNFPEAWHPLSLYTRRCLVKDFPYGVIYQITGNLIIVIAIANLHKKPNYWKNRI